MNYSNKNCSVCGVAFKEDDDIVVCPECATPHHRECWFSNGKCINHEKHSEGFVWTAEKTEAVENNTVTESTENVSYEETFSGFGSDSSTRICHICSSENPAESTHCGNCGAFFGNSEETTEVVNCAYCGEENNANALRCKRCGAPVMKIFRSDNPYLYATGMAPDEPVAGLTANEVSLYTQSASKYYLKKFKNIDNNKFTFNWAAFFFAPYWFFYRKLYKAGIAALLVFISVSMLITGLFSNTYGAIDEYYSAVTPIVESATISDADMEIMENASFKLLKSIAIPVLLSLFITLSEKIVCGLIADKLYYNKMREDIGIISEAVPDKELKQIMILKRGKPSVMAFAAALLGEQFLITIFTAIADFISK